jgi:hypothetical protein
MPRKILLSGGVNTLRILPARGRAWQVNAEMLAATIISAALISIHTCVGVSVKHIPSGAPALKQPGKVGALPASARVTSTFINILAQPSSQGKPWVTMTSEVARKVETVSVLSTRL